MIHTFNPNKPPLTAARSIVVDMSPAAISSRVRELGQLYKMNQILKQFKRIEPDGKSHEITSGYLRSISDQDNGNANFR